MPGTLDKKRGHILYVNPLSGEGVQTMKLNGCHFVPPKSLLGFEMIDSQALG